MKNWKRPPELNFVVLCFVAQCYTFAHIQHNVNFERDTDNVNFGFDKERVARLSPEKVWL